MPIHSRCAYSLGPPVLFSLLLPRSATLLPLFFLSIFLFYSLPLLFFFFFFFQAEDGIRDLYVTGVQTCALPISTTRFALRSGRAASSWRDLLRHRLHHFRQLQPAVFGCVLLRSRLLDRFRDRKSVV